MVETIDDFIDVDKKVSRIWKDTKGQATACDSVLVLTHAKGKPWDGPEDIDWEEPYKDGGADAAHKRVSQILSS